MEPFLQTTSCPKACEDNNSMHTTSETRASRLGAGLYRSQIRVAETVAATGFDRTMIVSTKTSNSTVVLRYGTTIVVPCALIRVRRQYTVQ